jgi:hypothetical protein
MSLEEIGYNLCQFERYSKNHIMVTADRLTRKYGKEDDRSIWAARWNRAGLSVKQIRWLMMEHVHGNLMHGGKQLSRSKAWTMWDIERLIKRGEEKIEAAGGIPR